MTIVHDQLQFIRSPKTVTGNLASDRNAAFMGFKNAFVMGILYEIAILLWYLGGAEPTVPPFVRIPEQQYYLYQLIFLLPMFLITWLLASAIGYLISKGLGARGSFDTILGGFGIAWAVSAYFTLIPDIVQGVLWTTGWEPFAEYQIITSQDFLAILVWVYLFDCIVALLTLYTATIHYSQDLSKSKSVFDELVAFFGSFGVWFTSSVNQLHRTICCI